MHKRYFTSLHILKEFKKAIHQRMINFKLDLNYFERLTVKNYIVSIIK